MTITQSKITRQGQVTVPAEIRKRLHLAPGSSLEWHEVEGEIVVRRAAKFDSEQIHSELFQSPPTPRTLEEIKQGIADRMRRVHARD
jgi:AbrB family looped-hinge helix DNA binding protein